MPNGTRRGCLEQDRCRCLLESAQLQQGGGRGPPAWQQGRARGRCAPCRDIRDPGRAEPLPEVGTWHLHKSSVSSSEVAIFQNAIISIL